MWKLIKGTCGYEANDITGAIRSTDRVVSKWNGQCMCNILYKGTLLKPKLIRGYENVSVIELNGKRRTRQVHRLVLETFNPIENMDKLQVNHINGVKHDNRLINLEWTTPKENTNHAYANGLAKYKIQNGELNLQAKLNESQVKEILSIVLNPNNRLSDQSIANMYGVTRKTISHIRLRQTWKHISI